MREQDSIPWKSDKKKLLGLVIGTMETAHINDDQRAGRLVGAKLEMVRGQTKDPSLEVIQLTSGTNADFTSKFALYKPHAR